MFYNAIISQDLKAITPEDVELTTLPLFHSFGQTVQMNASIYTGATNVLLTRFDVDAVLRAMETENVSLFASS